MKRRKLLATGLVLIFFLVFIGLGLKYFPFTKVVKMPAGSEKEFANPEMIHSLSPNTLYYDFEVASGNETPGGFHKGLAHSGEYAVKAFGQNSFSVAVERTAAEVGIENLKAVAISAWIYVFPTEREVKGNLVFTASNEVGVNVCWEGIGIVEPEVPRGKWFKVSKYFDLTPVVFKPDYKLQVYFWNNSNTDILVDDYFIAFGGAVDRRGDSARVDMTKPEGFVEGFNLPPFPVSFLEKAPLENSISPDDLADDGHTVAGNYFNTGNDGVLNVTKAGEISVHAFCTDKRQFRRVSLTDSASFKPVAPVLKILTGRFLSSGGDQFLVSGTNGWMLCEIKPPGKLCDDGEHLTAGLKILYKSDTVLGTACSGDFLGDGRSELLVVNNGGTWSLATFEPAGGQGGGLKVIEQEGNLPVSEWSPKNQETGISSGRFLPGLEKDVILTVFRPGGGAGCSYSIRKFNVAGRIWDPVFSEKQNYCGKTIGLDTLKPGDRFFEGPRVGTRPVIYRYNRDWRFDLKEIRFSDSAFSIRSVVDFRGYDKDRNPKYYESLKLVPGNFAGRGEVSLVVIGHLSKQRQYQAILPDFVHLYSFPVNK